MQIRHILIVGGFLGFAVPTAGAQDFTGREYAEAKLLLSESDFEVRLAAKSLYRMGTTRAEIPDLAAEAIWTACSGSRQMHLDALAWLIKAVGNTKQGRYAPLMDYCLSRLTDEKTVKYLKEAKANLPPPTGPAFEGGKGTAAKIRDRLQAQVAALPAAQREKQFEALRRDQSLDDVIASLGAPDEIRAINVPGNRVGHLYVKVRTSQDLMVLSYQDLGTIRFIFDEGRSNWSLVDIDSAKGLNWNVQEGQLATMRDLIATGGPKDLLKVAKYLNRQVDVDRDVLDQVAERIYRSRSETDDDLSDALAHLTKVIGKRRDGRYKKMLLDVADTAASRTLRKHAGKTAESLPDPSGEIFVPR